MIRVLNLFTIMNRGGAETMVMNYYRAMDRSKVQFDFLVHREEKGAYDDEILALGGRIYRMPSLHPKNWIRYKRMIRKFFKEHREYKIIHSHMSENGYFAFQEAKKQHVPVRICHAHNAPVKIGLKSPVRFYFKTGIRHYCTHMFACGEKAGLWLYGRKNADNIIIMRNAVDAKSFVYDPVLEESVKKEFGIEGCFVVGHVGSFKPAKNHRFIIDTFGEISNRKKNAVLLLVGEGELKKEIEEYAKKTLPKDSRVVFAGNRDDIPRILQGFDVFLFPSLWEGFPVSLVEAQAAGLPCFVSDRVSDECFITENVKVLDLNKPAREWAREILQKGESFYKKDMSETIISAGYDVQENVKKLSIFYRSGGKTRI